MSNEDTSNKAAVNGTPDTTYVNMQQRHEALAHAVGLGHNRFSTDEVVEAAEKFRTFLVGESTKDGEPEVDAVEPPTEPGFYKYSGGRQTLLFLLGSGGQWYALFDNGEAHACHWEYIEQALGVWDLVKIS